MKWLLVITDLLMLAYWILAGLLVLSVINIPPEYMYSDYENPIVVAWNWSFLPLDLIFIGSGLVAFLGNPPENTRRVLKLISLTTMFCAGLMAISFWAIIGAYDPVWWIANLWLMLLPVLVLFHESKTYAAVQIPHVGK